MLFVYALILVDSEIGQMEHVHFREKRIGFLSMYVYVWPDMAHVYVDVILISGWLNEKNYERITDDKKRLTLVYLGRLGATLKKSFLAGWFRFSDFRPDPDVK